MSRLLTAWTQTSRDGTRLVSDIYLPDVLPATTVVLRTPYGRTAHRAEGAGWAARGFAFVVQDVRGRYDSDGVWDLYAHERADGAGLVDAVTEQPWSDERVVTTGGSYAGFTAWTAAIERPKQVQVVLSTGPSMGLHRVKWDRSGVLRLAEHAAWWLERADSRTSRDGASAAVFGMDPTALEHLPVLALPERLGANLPGWAPVVEAGPDTLPRDHITDDELASFPGGALHVGGWYDLLLPEALHHWRTAGSAVHPRPPRRLVVGSWDHGFIWTGSTAVGAREHGAASRIPLGERQLDWVRDVLAGTAVSGTEVFTLGHGWRHAPHWPPATDVVRRWPGAGQVLQDTPPNHDNQPASETAFTHDPADPFPSAAPGTDRRIHASRTDALRFRSAELDQPLEMAGAPRLRLQARAWPHHGQRGQNPRASPPAPQTGAVDGTPSDWVVRLLEERGDGALLALSSGTASPRPADVTLEPLAVRLPAGSRLVLEITGADFPHLARNLGAPDRYGARDGHPVRQQVCLGPGTVLELPVACT